MCKIDDLDMDLEGYFEQWCAASGQLSEDDCEVLNEVLSSVAAQAYGEASDENIRSTLKILATTPGSTETTPNKSGMTPLPGEKSAKRFLDQLKTIKHNDAFGNDKAFSADSYKAFDREANRMGYNYSAKNDFNNQSPRRPLSNPTINVDTNNKAFEAVDSIGIGAQTHWRVVNHLTNEYVTRQIDKTQAEEIAAGLNQEYEQVLAEEGLNESTIVNAKSVRISVIKSSWSSSSS